MLTSSEASTKQASIDLNSFDHIMTYKLSTGLIQEQLLADKSC
jgi:hypothetical protein